MKKHFITGGTGFIGRYLVRALIRRGDMVFVLVREESNKNLDSVFGKLMDSKRLIFVFGDIRFKNLKIPGNYLKKLKKLKVDFVWHLAADLSMSLTKGKINRHKTNINGTRNVVNLANYIGAQLCYFSTIHVRGDAKGLSEYQLNVGQTFGNDYELTKFKAEEIVKKYAKVAYVIFRPGNVIGQAPIEKSIDCTMGYHRFIFIFYLIKCWFIHSLKYRRFTGGLLKIFGARLSGDGKSISLPFLVIPYARGIVQNLVPIEYVVSAALKIANNKKAQNMTFHLTHPKSPPYIVMLKAMLEDLSFNKIKYMGVNAQLFEWIFKVIYFVALPWRGYVKSFLIYISYLKTNDNFSRLNTNSFNTPPKPISRNYFKSVNRRAFDKEYPKIDLKSANIKIYKKLLTSS